MAVIGFSTMAIAHASLKSEIEALNKPIEAALMRRDVDGYRKIAKQHVTPDFIYTEGDTTMNFDQMIGRLRQSYSAYAKMTRVSIRVLSVQEHGATGTAVERQTTNGIVKTPGKKSHTDANVVVGTVTYRRVDGRWKMAAMSVKTEKVTVDGKPMPAGGAKRPASPGADLETP